MFFFVLMLDRFVVISVFMEVFICNLCCLFCLMILILSCLIIIGKGKLLISFIKCSMLVWLLCSMMVVVSLLFKGLNEDSVSLYLLVWWVSLVCSSFGCSCLVGYSWFCCVVSCIVSVCLCDCRVGSCVCWVNVVWYCMCRFCCCWCVDCCVLFSLFMVSSRLLLVYVSSVSKYKVSWGSNG